MLRLKCLIAAFSLLLTAGTASSSVVTFNVSGPNFLTGSTWTVDTATGLVPNGGLHGSADVMLTTGSSPVIDGLYDTDDSGFFHVFELLGAFPGPSSQLIITEFTTANFIGFTGGTFNDAFVPGGPSGISMTFTVASSVPEPSTWAMLILGFAGIGFLGYRRKSRLALRIA